MRRLALALLLWPSIALAQYAPQVWNADQDGANFICADVGYFQANNLTGVGTRCAEVDSTGKIIPMSVDCGTVTGVSGADGISCSPSSPNPTCHGLGVLVSGSGSPGTVNLGAGSNGTMQQTVSGGTATVTEFSGTTGSVPFYAANGQLSQNNSALFWDNIDSTLGVGTNAPFAGVGIHVDRNTNALFTPVFMTNANGGTGAGVGFRIGLNPASLSTNATTITIFGVGSTFGGIYAPTNVVWESYGGEVVMSQFNNNDFSWATTTSQTKRMWLKSAGNLQLLDMAAPSAPASGLAAVYIDSTAKTLFAKDGGGTTTHTVKTQSSSAGVALTGISDTGTWSLQNFQAPLAACTDYVSVSCQGGTSDIGTGGSNSAVQNVALHDGASVRWATAGGWANGFFLGLSGGNIRALTPTGDHKVMVSATDPTPDYLDTKFESTTGNIAVSHVTGPPEFVNLNVIMGGNTPQTMFWGWNMLANKALNNQFMCEGGSNTGNETCNQYPALQTFSSVTWSLNILNNTCTGGGTPTFTVRLVKNGTSVTSRTVSCGTTGVVSAGTASFAVSAGDVIGLVYDGTLFGTGGAGGVEAFVTARFDP